MRDNKAHYQKHREKILERALADYYRRKNDPDFVAKRRARAKARWLKLKTEDPERYREITRKSSRDYYYRRKEKLNADNHQEQN